MIGKSFQPGEDNKAVQAGEARGSGVQEAIKVLSLRLPKVVGAQGMTPMPLLQSQGSGGNPRVDSIVQSVLSKIFPTGQAAPQAPVMGQSFAPESSPMPAGPSFTGDVQPSYRQPTREEQQPYQPIPIPSPRVVVDNPFGHGDLFVGPDGRSIGSPPGSIAPGPDWGAIMRILGNYGTHPDPVGNDMPMF